MDLENQRYGRNKDTLVNKTYIESGEYRRKFDCITDNPKVNKALYDCAKKALIHRSGTALEDMYWIDGVSGDIIYSITDSTDERAIIYTDKIRNIVSNNNSIITLHTHPGSMPPSISDFNSNFINGYNLGVIACHDGKVFVYKSNDVLSDRMCDMYIQKFISNGNDSFNSQILALNKMSQNSHIYYREVKAYE